MADNDDEVLAAAHLKLLEDTRAIIIDTVRVEFPRMMEEFFREHREVNNMPMWHLLDRLERELFSRTSFREGIRINTLQTLREKLNSVFT